MRYTAVDNSEKNQFADGLPRILYWFKLFELCLITKYMELYIYYYWSRKTLFTINIR